AAALSLASAAAPLPVHELRRRSSRRRRHIHELRRGEEDSDDYCPVLHELRRRVPRPSLDAASFGARHSLSRRLILNCRLSIHCKEREKMPLGLILGLGRAFRRKRTSSLDILSSKRAPRNYYKGKNCKPTGFHTRKGGYVLLQEKLPNYVVPDLTDFKLKPYVSQCPREVETTEGTDAAK
ncbi:hypothetical protein EUGRSUZ_F00376, partial [Eucalyptus grandis]